MCTHSAETWHVTKLLAEFYVIESDIPSIDGASKLYLVDCKHYGVTDV